MPAYLITGHSGSGKTTIGRELKRRGFTVIDGDDGLARWEDAKTGQPVEVDHTKYVDYAKVSWNWDAAKIDKLIKTPGLVFLCGGASNRRDFYKKFDRVFTLVVTTKTLKHRILTRTDHDYGKHPKMLAQILGEHEASIQQDLDHGATAIDANPETALVADAILAHINHAN